jgi:hypothetical protein
MTVADLIFVVVIFCCAESAFGTGRSPNGRAWSKALGLL